MKNHKLTKSAMIAATLTAIVGSLCCIGPLILITLGLGSAWIGALGMFHAIHPYAVIVSALFLGYAFWQLYVKPYRCRIPNEPCPIPKSLRVQRIVFWIVLILAALLLAFPYYGTWLV